MKLRGTRTERLYREQLIKSQDFILGGERDPRLSRSVLTLFPKLRSVFALGSTPSQTFDIHTLLVDGESVVRLELNKLSRDEKPIVEVVSLNEYARELRASEQIQLAVAMELDQLQL